MTRREPKYERHPDRNNRWTNDGMTVDQVAQALGLSHATVCRIEAAAMRKMRIRMGHPFKLKKQMTREQLERKLHDLEERLVSEQKTHAALREHLKDYADMMEEGGDETPDKEVAADIHDMLNGIAAV